MDSTMTKVKLFCIKAASVISGLLLGTAALAEEQEPYLSLTTGITQVKTDLFASIAANLPAILAVFGALLIISVVVRFVRRLVGGR
jgi:hypothetical protein